MGSKLQKSTIIGYTCIICMLLIMVGSCEKDYLVPKPVPIPKVPVETTLLEARYVTTPPSTINSKYWSEADFLKVAVTDVNGQQIYPGDGLLNMTGTYSGLSEFNNGDNPGLTLKAAYDDNTLYLLAEWKDSDIDASMASWLWDGPSDPLKTDTTGGWTSQRNNDKLAFAFEIEPASSSAGNFSDVGCAASCHNQAMKPQIGKIDIWNWSLAFSEPMGYAFDMVTDADSGLVYDNGQEMITRNNAGATNRSGPAFEWDGTIQSITKSDGSYAILDPAFFLLNKTPFLGDPGPGDDVYIASCENCHGVNGAGDDGSALNRPGVMNRYSRTALTDYASSLSHDGQSYFNPLSATQRENLIARIRGFAGVPGYYLSMPDSSGADITSNTNVVAAKVNPTGSTYKVLLMRKLNTNYMEDVQFKIDISRTYKFGVALMDNDGKNHVGSLIETLTFK